MKLVVGLGNPGDKYENTRHNVGFMILDHFLKDYSSMIQASWSKNDKLKSEIAVVDWQPKEGKMERVILAKPQTYMNNSGMAVQLIAAFYKIRPEDIWIVNDELDLPLGSMKIRFGGAAAGHHGVESVIDKLGTDKFWRFRMGIGHEGPHNEHESKPVGDVEDYVLGIFSGKEKGKAKDLLKHGYESLEFALEKGIEKAMNRFNTK
jgi:PTH1 family peptidyl-tRNA hydrolase